MAKQTGSKKPKCGPGQSCGDACIAAHETCQSVISKEVTSAALAVIESHIAKKELGSGISGTVVQTDRDTAVKTVEGNTKGNFALEKEGAQILGDTGAGPKLIAYDEAKQQLELELVKGKSLRSLKADKDLSHTDEAKMDKLTIAAFAKLHRAGYAHNDGHGANILVDMDGNKASLIDGSYVAKVGTRKKMAGWSRLAQAGWHDMKLAGLNSDSVAGIQKSLTDSGALTKYEADYAAVTKLPDAKAAKARSKAEVDLHASYLKALTDAGF